MFYFFKLWLFGIRYQVSGIKYQVSSIKYQVTGMGFGFGVGFYRF